MNFISIKEALKKEKKEVALRGWVYRIRKQKEKIFLILRDSSDIVQCVIDRNKISKKEWENAEKILVESSIEIYGNLKKEKRAITGYEVKVSKLNIISFADVFPIKKFQSPELLLDYRHLWLRSLYMRSILKIRSNVFRAIREFFYKHGFYEFHSPSFTPVQCEGGSTLFKVDYFGKPIFLTQTWQLYAETALPSLEKIFTIAPSFRAEKSKTSRHLCEFWHAEMEAAWLDFNGLINYAEKLIKYVLRKILKENKEELKILKRDIKKLEPTIKKKFPRITYDKALKILEKKANYKIEWGKDLRTIEESKLTQFYDTPVIVTHYPKKIKAFYMKEDPKRPEVVLCTDILAPEGYGEIIGGSEREINIEKLKKNLINQGEDPKNYKFYLDSRSYGSIPHSGFGLGVERLISWICKLEHIRDAIPFPRTQRRWKP